MEIDPVPTGLAWAPDGGLYVSLLSGGPFIPGTSSLMHVAMDGTVTTVASGLTMLGDVTVAPDGSVVTAYRNHELRKIRPSKRRHRVYHSTSSRFQ